MKDLKYILSYLKYYKKDLFVTLALVIVETVFELVIPFLMSDIIDLGIAKVLGEEPYLTNFKNEIKEVSAFIKERSEIFINECKNVNLKTEPFKCGFFVTIPCQNDEAVYDYLVTKKVHVAPVGNAIRVAICSISKEHCKLLPKLIKEALLKA